MNTQEFPRVKVGVGQKPAGWDLANYVLGRFSEEDMKIIGPKINDVIKAVECMVASTIDKAMNQYNKK